jgi:hypothetical protein
MKRMLRCWKARAALQIKYWKVDYLTGVSKASWFLMKSPGWRSPAFAYLFACHGTWVAKKWGFGFQPSPELWRR